VNRRVCSTGAADAGDIGDRCPSPLPPVPSPRSDGERVRDGEREGSALPRGDCAKDQIPPNLLRQAAQQALRRGLVTKPDLRDVEVALEPCGGLAT